MPTYVYECKACSRRYEKRQSMTDEPERVCPDCEGEVRRVIFPVGIIFKGSGFYATDHKSGGATAVPGESEGAPSAASGDNGKDGNGHKPAATAEAPRTETKGETKGEAKAETKTESKPEAFGRKELKAAADLRAKAN